MNHQLTSGTVLLLRGYRKKGASLRFVYPLISYKEDVIQTCCRDVVGTTVLAKTVSPHGAFMTEIRCCFILSCFNDFYKVITCDNISPEDKTDCGGNEGTCASKVNQYT